MESFNNELIPVKSFDNNADVFFWGENFVIRAIYKEHKPKYLKVIEILSHQDLNELGIIETELTQEESVNMTDKYSLFLKHKKIHFITYPHEWPSDMLKEAAIFHINLYQKIYEIGLTLKDFHPYNILFDGTHPIFVDFTSIIPLENLLEEEYLMRNAHPLYQTFQCDQRKIILWKIHQRMFAPYFLFPLYMMGFKKYTDARLLLSHNALNIGKVEPQAHDVFRDKNVNKMRYHLFSLLKRIALLGIPKSTGIKAFWHLSKLEIEGLRVSRINSGYIDYYDRKKENFDFEDLSMWKNKNLLILEMIKKHMPSTFLDIGCNTGWYSILAAKNGARVISMDIEESCVNRLYQYSKENDLLITPVVLDFSKINESFFSELKDEFSQDNSSPILMAARQRFKSEMVIVLALLHHLILGQGMQLSNIVQTLYSLTRQILVLEFVDINDALIKDNLSFFPRYNQFANGYCINHCLTELRKCFSEVEIYPSTEDTRKLLVCYV
jgi:hypothetical protein